MSKRPWFVRCTCALALSTFAPLAGAAVVQVTMTGVIQNDFGSAAPFSGATAGDAVLLEFLLDLSVGDAAPFDPTMGDYSAGVMGGYSLSLGANTDNQALQSSSFLVMDDWSGYDGFIMQFVTNDYYININLLDSSQSLWATDALPATTGALQFDQTVGPLHFDSGGFLMVNWESIAFTPVVPLPTPALLALGGLAPLALLRHRR